VIGTAQALTLTVTGALPAFLTSALSVQIRGELGLGPADLGIAVSLLFATSGMSARFLGRLVQAYGTDVSYPATALLAAASLALVASSPTFWTLVIGLVIGGVANAAAQPTANLLLTQLVRPHRLGLAMGIKQSYIPLASLVGGLTVPTVALAFGWRAALVLGVAFCIAVSALRPNRLAARSSLRASRTKRPGPGYHPGLVLLTIGGGFAAGAATALGVFLVDYSVAAGLTPTTAGLLLATCSCIAFGGRVALGWLADASKQGRLYVLVAHLMLASVGGYGLLAVGDRGWVITGATLAYAGWTWTGLLHLGFVKDSVDGVARATGLAQTGLALGAAAGPLLLGTMAEVFSYTSAWLLAAFAGLIGVALTHAGQALLTDRSPGV
jgi:MFS family permease